MNMANIGKYLLAIFSNKWAVGLFFFLAIAKLIIRKIKNNNPAVTQLCNRIINMAFILAAFYMVGISVFNDSPGKKIESATITQSISNNRGTSINSAGDANIGSSASSATTDSVKPERPGHIDQHIENNEGMAINAAGDVSISLEK